VTLAAKQIEAIQQQLNSAQAELAAAKAGNDREVQAKIDRTNQLLLELQTLLARTQTTPPPLNL